LKDIKPFFDKFF